MTNAELLIGWLPLFPASAWGTTPGMWLRKVVWVIGGGLAAIVPSAPGGAWPPDIAADCMRFVADVTMPHGSEVSPGQVFEKVWRVENCGETTWDGYRAVRVTGEYGPSAFDVPRTAPSGTANLSVTIEAPASTGSLQASYRLEGPNGRFGEQLWVSLIVVTVDCDPPTPVLAPGQPPDAQALVLSARDLGANWCLLSSEGHETPFYSSYEALYRNWTESVSPRTVWLSLWLMRSGGRSTILPERLAATAVVDLSAAHRADTSTLDWEWPIGDGPAFRARDVGIDGRLVTVEYVFCAGPTTVATRVSGPPELEDELDALALRLASAQEGRIRTMLQSDYIAPCGFGAPSAP